jgi:hypothetical protein
MQGSSRQGGLPRWASLFSRKQLRDDQGHEMAGHLEAKINAP